MSKSLPIAVMRGAALITVNPYPAGAPNPSKFRWAIYRDGHMVGAARTKQDAQDRIEAGYYDQEQPQEGTVGP